MYVCVRACMRACMRACVRVCEALLFGVRKLSLAAGNNVPIQVMQSLTMHKLMQLMIIGECICTASHVLVAMRFAKIAVVLSATCAAPHRGTFACKHR